MTVPPRRVKIGSIGIDSGQVLIGDPCYLRDFKNDEYNEETEQGNFSYSGACNTTTQAASGGVLYGEFGNEAAVVASTGYGDGLYDVFATYNDENRVAKLEIIFIEGEK